MRCEDAFEEFALVATNSLTQPGSNWLAYRAYNAYARFIHHLFEFMSAAYCVERQDTSSPNSYEVDRFIQNECQRILSGRRQSIINGTAPSWENHISAYPEVAPTEFSVCLRRARNIAFGHAKHQRMSYDLSEFYRKYHGMAYLIFYNIRGFWGHRSEMWEGGGEKFPHLGQVTAFSIAVDESKTK